MIEEELKNLRLSAPADGLRQRVLAVADTARRDRRLGRWIGGVAAAAIMIAGLAGVIADRDQPDRAQHSDGGSPPRFLFPDESLQEVRR